MKFLHSILFCFLLFSQNGLSQTEPQLIKYNRSVLDHQTNEFWTQSEQEFTYDNFGNVKFLNYKIFQSNGKIDSWRGFFYEYDENQSLIKRKYRNYNESVDLWISDFWYEYIYDENECMVERSTISNTGGGGVKNKIVYERDNECRMLSETVWIRSNVNDPFYIYSLHTWDYHPDGNSYDEAIFGKSPDGDSIYLRIKETHFFDEEMNEIENYWTSFGENNIASNFLKRTFEYDNYGNLILKKSYIKLQNTSEWVLSTVINYYLEYDENGFLIENRKEYISHEPEPPVVNEALGKTIYYKNSCEGITEETLAIHGEATSEIREEFVYQGINQCLELEKLELYLEVFPNPSNGEIEINSPIFKTGDTEILVYSIDGKVLLQKTENSRCTFSNLDLSLLQNGFYILQLRNGDHFVKEKIVIAK